MTMVTTFSRQNEAARHVSSTHYVDSAIQRLNNRGLLDGDLIIRWLACTIQSLNNWGGEIRIVGSFVLWQ